MEAKASVLASMFSMCSGRWCIRIAGMELTLSSPIVSYPADIVHVFTVAMTRESL